MHRTNNKPQVKQMKKTRTETDTFGPIEVNAVLLSRKDYDFMAETAYLLRSPANAKHLLEALKRPKKARKSFKSVAALKHALGL
jgi:antitoxin YefM